jgi:putative oxidoreductase
MRHDKTFASAHWGQAAYSAMRIVIGFLFLSHGVQKLFGMWGGQRVALETRLGAAGVIETIGGMLIIVGLFTTAAALLASLEMVAAYLLAHAPRGGLPIQNGGELAVAYCFIFLYMVTQGDGSWSLAALARPSGRRPVHD